MRTLSALQCSDTESASEWQTFDWFLQKSGCKMSTSDRLAPPHTVCLLYCLYLHPSFIDLVEVFGCKQSHGPKQCTVSVTMTTPADWGRTAGVSPGGSSDVLRVQGHTGAGVVPGVSWYSNKGRPQNR